MERANDIERTHSRLNRLCAIGVFSASCIAYLATVAPTVCFWDCGEYVAAGHSLGVPHPPGNPLFILIARMTGMALFFIKDVGLRLNYIAVVSSAIMAMLVYLSIVRAFVGWMGVPRNGWQRITVYLSGIVGALFAAFGSTVWFSSVESEVNAPVLVPIALCTWLVLVWAQSKSPRRDMLLVLITYISFLGIGIHMFSMITLGPLFLYVIIVDPEKRTDWRLWITGLLMGLVMYDISWFILLGGIAAVISLFMSFAEGKHRSRWRLCFHIALFGILGFSSHLYIPIRSALNPMIDENHPAAYQSFKEYLQRKQYGSESMITRMFWRRGTWAHQFGIEGHMGFGGFFLTQFFRFSPLDTEKNFVKEEGPAGWGKLFVYLLPTAFMLFGAYFLYRKNKGIAALFGSLLLMTTVVLVLYHNFSDGTKSEKRDYRSWVESGRQGPQPLVHREVRVRDYFYIVGFMYYGLWMGIACGGALFLLYTNRKKLLRTTVAPVCTVLFAASPALPFSHNMPLQTRRGDFVPYDYAYNLLMSCEHGGVLFTNGDNDTFPLWALQEAYGIRRDVRIINLSLLNTKWYIKQLKRIEPRVPISFTDARIEGLRHSINPITEPTRYTLPHAGLTVNLPTRRERMAMRIQDQMVVNIVDAAEWKKPVYFAVTVSEDNYMGLGPYLQMQGLVYRVVPRDVTERDKVDLARTLYLLDRVYRYTGLGDGTTPLNDTSEKLLSNYVASFLQIAMMLRTSLQREKNEIARLESLPAASPDSLRALEMKKKAYNDTLGIALGKLDQCISLMPWDWRPRTVRHELYISSGRPAEAESAMREALKIEPGNADYLRMLVQALEKQGKTKEAAAVARTILDGGDTNAWDTYCATARHYAQAGYFDSAIAVVEQFANFHPGDKRTAAAISELRRLREESKRPSRDSGETAAAPSLPAKAQ